MAIEIPLINNPYYTFSIQLDLQVYNIGVQWSTREQSWYFSIADADNNPIINNIKLMPFTDLTKKHSTIKIPANAIFYCMSTTDDDSPPGRNDLGDRIRLYYLTRGEIA